MTQAEFDYYAANSGLPASSSLSEHKRAFFMAELTVAPDGPRTVGELEYAFYLQEIGRDWGQVTFSDARWLYYSGELGVQSGAVSDLMQQFFLNPPDSGQDVMAAGSSSATSATGFTLSLPVPAGTAVGDVLVAVLASQTTKSASGSDWTAAGFARTDNAYAAAGAGDRVQGMYAMPVTSIPSSPIEFTRVSGTGRNVGVLVRLTGAEAAAYLDAAQDSYSGADGVPTGQARKGAALFTVGGLELFWAHMNYSAPNAHVGPTIPAGFTELALVSTSADPGVSRTVLWVGYRRVSAGTTGEPQYVSPSPVASISAGHAVFKGGARTLATYTVPDMIADFEEGPVRMAHRLGSGENSEFTKVAGDKVVAQGYRILEFSVRYDSQGVAWGVHDATMDRTTALTGDVVTKTTAELSGLAVDAFTADGGVMQTLAQFLTNYGGGQYVLMIEDKTYAVTPMLNQIEAALGSQAIANARVVFKANGAGSWAPIVKARGYKIWSYVTGAEVDALAASEYLDDIDFVALNRDATVGQWATARSLGKPLWAHVIGSQQQAADAVVAALPERLAGLQVATPTLVRA